MKKDTLFLLPPGFIGDERREYCPECAEIWGLLSYFPALKESLEIRYQDISRPRIELVNLLGEANQNCPSLVLHSTSPRYAGCGIQLLRDTAFIDNARDIGLYYSERFGLPSPRGSYLTNK